MAKTKRALSVFLAVALLAGCLSVFAGASGVFRRDNLTLHIEQQTSFFSDAIASYGAPLYFTCSEDIIRVNGDGRVDYIYDDSSYQQAVEDGWDGFMPLSHPQYGTVTVKAYNGDRELVGAVTVKVTLRWWFWLTVGLPFALPLLLAEAVMAVTSLFN